MFGFMFIEVFEMFDLRAWIHVYRGVCDVRLTCLDSCL